MIDKQQNEWDRDEGTNKNTDRESRYVRTPTEQQKYHRMKYNKTKEHSLPVEKV